MKGRWSVLAVALVAGSSALADGMYAPSQVNYQAWAAHRERTLVNEPSQKAMVMLRNGLENLVISPGVEGNATDFAWIIPVPKRPQMDIVKGALFHELARLIAPEPPRASQAMGFGGQRVAGAAPPAVTVIERKVVGAYDVSVLSATDSGALMRWLKQNRYHVMDAARKPIAQYIREGWTFVACRVKVPGDAAGLATGTLAPLKLTFPSTRLVYPMRLSAANPKPFDVLVYVVTDYSHRPFVIQAPNDYSGLLKQTYDSPGEPLRFLPPRGGPPLVDVSDWKHNRLPRPLPPGLGFLRIRAIDVDTSFDANPTIVGLTMNHRFSISAWGSGTILPSACTKDFVWTVN